MYEEFLYIVKMGTKEQQSNVLSKKDRSINSLAIARH
jgi:hypothetical protein